MELETELGGNYRLMAQGRECLTDEFFV